MDLNMQEKGGKYVEGTEYLGKRGRVHRRDLRPNS
jgi:hypothetical protein